jgi:hypothetical protein
MPGRPKAVTTAEGRQVKREAVERDRHASDVEKQMRKQAELERKEAGRREVAVQREAERAAARQRKQWEKELQHRQREAARAAERDAREVERCVGDLVRRVEALSGRQAKVAGAEAQRQRAVMGRQQKAAERARRDAAEWVEARERRERRREARPVLYAILRVGSGEGGSLRVRLWLCRPNETPDGPSPLSTVASRLLREYDPSDSSEAFGKGHRWTRMLRAAESHLQAAVGGGVVVRSSMGCGRWAFVPWLVVADPGESTQHGLYIQYLFAPNCSSLYLCLGQGTSKLKMAFGQAAAARHLQLVAAFVRRKCREMLEPELQRAGFDLDGRIDLQGGVGGGSALAAQYEQGVILSRRYDAELPEEGEMLSHLRCLLGLYARVLRDEEYVNRIVRPSDAQLATVYGAKLAAIRDSVAEWEEGGGEGGEGGAGGAEGGAEEVGSERRSDGWSEDEEKQGEGAHASAPAVPPFDAGDDAHGWVRHPSRKRAEAGRGVKQHERVWLMLKGASVRLEVPRVAKRGRQEGGGKAGEHGEEDWFQAQRERSKARRLAQGARGHEHTAGEEASAGATGGGGVGEDGTSVQGGAWEGSGQGAGDESGDVTGSGPPPLPAAVIKTEAGQPLRAPPPPTPVIKTEAEHLAAPTHEGAWGGGGGGAWGSGAGGLAKGVPRVWGGGSGDAALAAQAEEAWDGVAGGEAGAETGTPEAASHASESGDPVWDDGDPLADSADPLDSGEQLGNATEDELEDGFEALAHMGHGELQGLWDEAGEGPTDGGEMGGVGGEQTDGGEVGVAGEAGGDGAGGLAVAAGPTVGADARGTAVGRPSRWVGNDRAAVRRAADLARASAAERAGVALQAEALPGSPGFVTEVKGVGKLLLSTRNATGYQGVFMPRDKSKPGRPSKYVAFLNCGGVTKHIGSFHTALEAAICYTRRKNVLAAKSAHIHKRPRPRNGTLLEPFVLQSDAGEALAPAAQTEAPAMLMPMEVEEL